MSEARDWATAQPTRKGEAWVRREGDGVAVFNPETRTLHLLNPSALAIWELCDGETTAREMAEAVDVITGMGEGPSRDDVITALDNLAAAGLIAV